MHNNYLPLFFKVASLNQVIVTCWLTCNVQGLSYPSLTWSISWWLMPCRHCSNYIFILDLTPGFNKLGKDYCKKGRETFNLLGFSAPYITGLTPEVRTPAGTGMIKYGSYIYTGQARVVQTDKPYSDFNDAHGGKYGCMYDMNSGMAIQLLEEIACCNKMDRTLWV